jgi:hypothetical protein
MQPVGNDSRIKLHSDGLLEDRDPGDREHPCEFTRGDSVTDAFGLIS